MLQYNHPLVWDNDQTLFPTKTPDELASTPIKYLSEDIVMDAWPARLQSQHPLPWTWRIRYHVPATAGFVVGTTAVQRKLKNSAPIVTSGKPILVTTSNGDDVLDTNEIGKYSKWISDGRQLIRFDYNMHDVFLGLDKEDETLAIDFVQQWLACEFLGNPSKCQPRLRGRKK